MSYQEDSLDWQGLQEIDSWLDAAVAKTYKEQPLAQDWARISKVSEEIGEAIQAFIGVTGQNPRKRVTHTMQEVQDELADVIITALCAMIHFAKDPYEVRATLTSKQWMIYERMRESLTKNPV